MHRFFIFTAVLFVGLTAAPVEAYTVSQTASVRIDDRHTAYLITYNFGHEKYDFSLPALAQREERTNLNALGYSLRTPEGLTVKDGLALASIWSNTKRLDHQYIAPVGTSTEFTLIVLHQKAASSSRANTLTVDALPFLIGSTPSALAANELKAYTVSASGTPALPTEEAAK